MNFNELITIETKTEYTKHPKCKIKQCNSYFDPIEYECGYMTKIDCDDCKYNGRGGIKNPEAKCNQI